VAGEKELDVSEAEMDRRDVSEPQISEPEVNEADASERDGFMPPGWPVWLWLLVAIVGSVMFAVAFIIDASTAWIGGSLAAALLGVGVALAYWGRDLAGGEVAKGPYPVPPDDLEEQAALAEDVKDDVNVVTRRRFLAGLLVGGVGVFALSQVVLAGALGPRPRRKLFSTGWRAGIRLVTFDGRPVKRDALAGGGILVVYPEGRLDVAASSQATLLRLQGLFTPLPGRETWSPDGFLAYSRVCTHAGCAVSQYEDQAQLLVCPCHQSTFDVLHGARPVAGPAARALPQLPLAIDAQGYLIAQSDFTESVGPGFWNAT
jgi:quinol---cytochrome c reductase iron-sulfur subunit